MINIWIETASSITRAGLETLFAARAGIQLADSLDHADVILADSFPDAPSASAPRVVLSNEPLTALALQWGVRAVLPPHASARQIVAAVEAVAAGLIAVPVQAASLVIPSHDDEVDPLTPRELEAFEMLAEGLSNKQIAVKLQVSEHTAKFHVNSILGKLRAGTRTEAVMRGLRKGILKV